MFKYTFDYFGNPIVITTDKKLSSKLADNIHKLVQDLGYDLNHSAYNSSAYIFNETKPGSEASVSKEFIDFLDLNIFYSTKYLGFYPFIINKNKFTGFEDITKFIKINKKNSRVIKNEKIIFDTTYLRTYVILDLITELLKIKNTKNILITYNDMFRTLGEMIWEVDHYLDEDYKVSNQIKDETIVLDSINKSEQMQNKNFLSMDKPINHKYLIIKGEEGFAKLHILKELSKNLFMTSDYDNFSNLHNIEIIAFDENKNRFEFKKS